MGNFFLLEREKREELFNRLVHPKFAIGIIPYLDGQIQLVRRVHPPFPGRYSIITGHLGPHDRRESVLFQELYEELYSQNPLENNPQLSQLHKPDELFEVDDVTTGYRIFVYDCLLHSWLFRPYTEEVDDVKSFVRIRNVGELNPLTQFILRQLDLLEQPDRDIRYVIDAAKEQQRRRWHTRYAIEYDHSNTASISS